MSINNKIKKIKKVRKEMQDTIGVASLKYAKFFVEKYPFAEFKDDVTNGSYNKVIDFVKAISDPSILVIYKTRYIVTSFMLDLCVVVPSNLNIGKYYLDSVRVLVNTKHGQSYLINPNNFNMHRDFKIVENTDEKVMECYEIAAKELREKFEL